MFKRLAFISIQDRRGSVICSYSAAAAKYLLNSSLKADHSSNSAFSVFCPLSPDLTTVSIHLTIKYLTKQKPCRSTVMFITQAHLKTPPPALLYPVQVYQFSVVLIGPDSHLQFWEGNLKTYFPLPLLPQECYMRNSLNAGKCYTIQVLIKTPSLWPHYKKYNYTHNAEWSISEVK